jgi:hypothetical protein
MKYTLDGRSQCSKVLAFMRDAGEITVRDAGKYLGCFCLHKRIAELRKDGWNIDSSQRHTYTNEDGARVTVAVHKLVEPWYVKPEARTLPADEDGPQAGFGSMEYEI